MLPPTAKRHRRVSRKQLQRSVSPGGASAAMRWPSAVMTQLLVQGEPAPVRSHQDAAHDILARGRDGPGRSQRAARRRHTDQRVVRRLDPFVRHVAATTRVAGEATEADRLDSRALLEAEHEVRVVQYAVRSLARRGAVLAKSHIVGGKRCAKTDTVSGFLGDRVGQKTQNQGGVNLTDVCKIGFH